MSVPKENTPIMTQTARLTHVLTEQAVRDLLAQGEVYRMRPAKGMRTIRNQVASILLSRLTGQPPSSGSTK